MLLRKILFAGFVIAAASEASAQTFMCAGRQSLPDTAACRDYCNFAMGAGIMGSLGPLEGKYSACMNSARSNSDVRKQRCDGGYIAYVAGVKKCVKD